MVKKVYFFLIFTFLLTFVYANKDYSQIGDTEITYAANINKVIKKSQSIVINKALDSLSVYITADPNVICLGNSSQLNAVASGGSGSYSLHWDSSPSDPSLIGQEIISNPVVSPQVITTYTVFVMDGESNVVSNYLTLVVAPIPMADFSADKFLGTVPIDISFTNLSLNANTYFWDFGDGNTSTGENPIHTYTQAGVYPIKLMATNSFTGCTDSITKEGYIDVIAGINSNYIESINFYPNPASKYIYLNMPKTETINQLIIYNNLGQKVLQLNDVENKVDISMLKKGLYIIELQMNNKLFRDKIIIN